MMSTTVRACGFALVLVTIAYLKPNCSRAQANQRMWLPAVPPRDKLDLAFRPFVRANTKTVGGSPITGIDPVPEDFQAATQASMTAFGRYPLRLVKENVEAVHVVQNLKIGGTAAVSGWSESGIFISSVPHGPADDAIYAQQVETKWHESFAKILLARHRSLFPEAEWNAALPSGFSYDGSIASQMGWEQTQSTVEDLRAGFVSRFSRSHLANDVSALAAQLFVTPSSVRAWSKQSMPLARKLRVLIKFYERLDPSMNDAFFAALRDLQ